MALACRLLLSGLSTSGSHNSCYSLYTHIRSLHGGLTEASLSSFGLPKRASSLVSAAGRHLRVLTTASAGGHYCRKCGGRTKLEIPPGDNRERHLCISCGYIDYLNPKMVVGCIVEHEGKVLLCRRGIDPCKGLWTLPAGFLEMNESTADGAVRETAEEANANVAVVAPYSHLDIPVIGQTYIWFRAMLQPPFSHSPGHETIETRLFSLKDLPFDEIAFSSVSLTLQHYLEDIESGCFRIHHGVIVKKRGTKPNEPGSFVLEDHIAVPTTAVAR